MERRHQWNVYRLPCALPPHQTAIGSSRSTLDCTRLSPTGAIRRLRCPFFSEFGGTPNLSSILRLTQPSPWSVQLILRCVVYFKKLAKVIIIELVSLDYMANSKLFCSVMSLSSIKLRKLRYVKGETISIFAFSSVLRMRVKIYIRPSDISSSQLSLFRFKHVGLSMTGG